MAVCNQRHLAQRGLMTALLALSLAAGCGREPAASTSATVATTPKLQPVELALNWYPEAEHGGFYAALIHGEFEKEGLQVTIRPGGPQAPVLQAIATERVPFGVINADALLLGRAQEADVVAVMVPIHDSPRCILVHEESGIQTLDDLAKKPGLTLAMNSAQPFALFLRHKLDLSQAQIVSYPGNVVQFLLDKNFAQQAYSFSEPFVAQQQGAKTRSLMVSDAGFNTYTSALAVSRKTLETQPELVKKFVRASTRGWQRYLQDAQATNAHIHQQNPEMKLDVLEFGVAALQPLCRPTGTAESEFGRMDPDRWSSLVQQMETCGALKPGVVDPAKAFSNDFLPAPAQP